MNQETNLKDETIEQIAKAISTEALQYVQSDNRFADLYVTLLCEFMKNKIGTIDPIVEGGIVEFFLDQTFLTVSNVSKLR